MQGTAKRQFETGQLMRLVALSCIVLVVFIAGLEAMHSHSEATVARNSAPCAICISAHANAPAATVHLLPTLHAVEAIPVLPESEGKSAISELRLFIRPPPSLSQA
jgi:hypothetical protein